MNTRTFSQKEFESCEEAAVCLAAHPLRDARRPPSFSPSPLAASGRSGIAAAVVCLLQLRSAPPSSRPEGCWAAAWTVRIQLIQKHDRQNSILTQVADGLIVINSINITVTKTFLNNKTKTIENAFRVYQVHRENRTIYNSPPSLPP